MLAAGCSDGCGNTLVTRSAAPDGRHAAAMFERDCGATTGFSTQISILAPAEQPAGAGNVFRADDDHGAAPIGDWNGSWAELKWLSADRLLIRYAARSRIFEQRRDVSGVQITYQIVAP
jgi:hypothetical protein